MSRLQLVVESLLEKPWKLGAQGPEAYDCWSLVRHVQRALFGREVPIVELPETTAPHRIARLFETHPGNALWREAPRPSHGGGVLLSSAKSPLHCGVWLQVDGGVLLHCAEGVGVCADDLLKLKALGYYNFRFRDWIGPGGPDGGPAAARAGDLGVAA